ncbi:hypothetical protein [Nocardia sp. NPDC049526]|uniref:hypothetical protein n=1 Tax=Nocardia sp. NPDC049526 TaxID=3364316 RepID=UPI00379D4471
MAGRSREGSARSAKLAGMPTGIMARRGTATGRAIMTGVPRGELDDALIDRAADKVFALLGELGCGAMKLGQSLSVAEGADRAPGAGHARPGVRWHRRICAQLDAQGRSSSWSTDGCPASRAMTKRPSSTRSSL